MYFELEQDKRIRNRFRFRDIESTTRGEFEPEEFGQIQDITVLFTLGDRDSIYPDVVDAPVFMVSDALKKLLSAYDPEVLYRRVALNQVKEHIQKKYWLLLTEKIDCLNESSEWHANGWDKRIVLNREQIGQRRVFKVKGIRTPRVFVNLEVSESILRREFEGITLRPVEVV
ncbi:MAG: hypothetical protein HDR00_12310 [Lachnospiraceae bacterium]|nr:hypothetical protein [Lachnospiraceae bacterium]MBD5541946.1 hypothetical protein [Lachnospiraceae bacterium]